MRRLPYSVGRGENGAKSRVNSVANLAGAFSFFLDMLYTFRISLRATGEFEVKLALRRAHFEAHFIRVCFSVSLFYRVWDPMMGQRPSAIENAIDT